MASTAFTGMGFDSMKLACISGRYWRRILRAFVQSFFSAAAVISDISFGISFEATETIPTPPREITGKLSRHVIEYLGDLRDIQSRAGKLSGIFRRRRHHASGNLPGRRGNRLRGLERNSERDVGNDGGGTEE